MESEPLVVKPAKSECTVNKERPVVKERPVKPAVPPPRYVCHRTHGVAGEPYVGGRSKWCRLSGLDHQQYGR
jgi:hypothetical protein